MFDTVALNVPGLASCRPVTLVDPSRFRSQVIVVLTKSAAVQLNVTFSTLKVCASAGETSVIFGVAKPAGAGEEHAQCHPGQTLAILRVETDAGVWKDDHHLSQGKRRRMPVEKPHAASRFPGRCIKTTRGACTRYLSSRAMV